MQGFKRFCVKLNPCIFKKKKKLNDTCVAGAEWEPVNTQKREAGVAVQAEREHPTLPGEDRSIYVPFKEQVRFLLVCPTKLYLPSLFDLFYLFIFFGSMSSMVIYYKTIMFISRLRRRLTCWGDRGSIWSWSVGGSNAGSSSPDTMWSRTWPERCGEKQEKHIPSSTQSHFRSQFYDTYLSFCLFV